MIHQNYSQYSHPHPTNNDMYFYESDAQMTVDAMVDMNVNVVVFLLDSMNFQQWIGHKT